MANTWPSHGRGFGQPRRLGGDKHPSSHPPPAPKGWQVSHSRLSIVDTIGNTGTHAGASGSSHAQLHLHWELHIDGHYLAIGLSDTDTRAVYTALFTDATG